MKKKAFNVFGSNSPRLCRDIIPSDTPQLAAGRFIPLFIALICFIVIAGGVAVWRFGLLLPGRVENPVVPDTPGFGIPPPASFSAIHKF